MIRVIKRYESRKLYDTEESRYVSLDDIALWVREGQEVRVVDNATSADVTAQVLTQIILDEGKKGTSFLPTELLHELVRAGEKAVATGVEQVQGTVDRLVQASFDRLGPVRRAREEMSHLRTRLTELEQTLQSLETETAATPKKRPVRRKATTKSTTSKSATTKSAAAKSTTAKRAATKAAKGVAAKRTTAPAKTEA